ncbi:CynX/NimT family MFS transporter [Natronoglycomyces albus]|uniref:MFS transporter n=1 Tax=Natronoglycomyces albus TaxID=2811108 RepID=A0A895XPJ1_9ACTN|nr:MFS transporter [Natronoglycomyces albus]QSB04200.1 MFS transporter [Natronoglycomyces albus]
MTQLITKDLPPVSSTRAATAALAVTIGSVIPVFLLGGLAVQIIAELSMSATQLGLVVSLYFAVSGVTSILCGRAVEKFGMIAGSYVGIGLAAASLIAVAVFAHSFAVLAILMALAAPANGFGQLAANAILATYGSPQHKGLLFGLKQAAIPMSTMLAGASVPLLALTVGWRWAFIAAAVLSLLAIPQLRGIPARRKNVPASQSERTNPAPAKSVMSPGLILMTVATGVAATGATPTGSFLADYATSIGVSASLAGLNLTLGGLVGVFARTFVGGIADRNGGTNPFSIIVVLLLIGTAGLLTFTLESHWLLPVATILAFAFGWSWPGLLNFGVASLYRHTPAAATGVTQTGVYIGGALGPLGFGLLVDHSGYQAAWVAAAACMLLAAALIETSRRMLRNENLGV